MSLISMRLARQIICVWRLLLERPAIRRTGLESSISFTTDRPGGGEIHLLRSTLPGLSLAMKAHAGYDIASGLLRTYLGNDAGSRVHSGAVERGTVDSLLSVLWYADLRGFTRISDVSSGGNCSHAERCL
jgi:adenylate cyclase